MLQLTHVRLPAAYTKADLECIVQKMLRVPAEDILQIQFLRRSLDARRKRDIHYECSLLVQLRREDAVLKTCLDPHVRVYQASGYQFPFVPLPLKRLKRPRIIVAGSGPSGLFCALMLARAGLRPIVLERGASVEERQRDVSHFWSGGRLDPQSNVQFGEGGAGTFSDGKLTCGKNDPRIGFVLHEFVKAGAPEEIEYVGKPHIGTDYLPQVVRNIRREIESLGGEVRFHTQLMDIDVQNGRLRSITTLCKGGVSQEEEADILVLCVGHSARDTFQMLHARGIAMVAKPFSVGVRIEHPRSRIDRIQYGAAAERLPLPAADYKLACHGEDGRGAYTFCMCPGGTVVASASEEGGVVTNGMSRFARDAENSNSALLVSVSPEDYGGGPLDGVAFQRSMEQKAFILGGSNYFAPAQRVADFMQGRASSGPGRVTPSYAPGVTFTDLRRCLPEFVTVSLKNALLSFEQKMPGFLLQDAVLTGVETRSSSPVRMVRDEDMQSCVRGVYPCGEGAGYAGGIMSCAVDGIKCAEKIVSLQTEN